MSKQDNFIKSNQEGTMTCRSNQKGRKDFPVRLPVLENGARLRRVEHHPCANEHLLPWSIGQFLGDPSKICTCHHSYDVESRWRPGDVFGLIWKQINILYTVQGTAIAVSGWQKLESKKIGDFFRSTAFWRSNWQHCQSYTMRQAKQSNLD